MEVILVLAGGGALGYLFARQTQQQGESEVIQKYMQIDD